MSRHLGGALTAFIDGELDDARREDVLVHLAHCASCRHEVEFLRGLKASLRGEHVVPAPEHLAARLLAVTAPVGHPHPVPRPHLPRRSALEHHVFLRRTALGVGALAIGVGGALIAAGPAPGPPAAPVDPTNAGFVIEHVSTANEVPFAGTDVLPVPSPTVSPSTSR